MARLFFSRQSNGNSVTAGPEFSKRPCGRRHFDQRGSILPLLVASLVVTIAMTGLAIDLGHAYIARTRAQNAVDAAVLSAAREFQVRGENTSSTVLSKAIDAATWTFNKNMTNNRDAYITVSGPDITFASSLAGPYSSRTKPANFVRVSASASLPPWFTKIVRNANLTLASSAVSGTLISKSVCAATPLIFCGGAASYSPGTVYPITISTSSTDISGGYFMFADMKCGSGLTSDPSQACIRQNMAGTPQDFCITIGMHFSKKPGQNVGQWQQGINTRFGVYQGGGLSASDYPADFNTTENIRYASYVDSANNGRRRINVAIADCVGSGKNVDVSVTRVVNFLSRSRPTIRC